MCRACSEKNDQCQLCSKSVIHPVEVVHLKEFLLACASNDGIDLADYIRNYGDATSTGYGERNEDEERRLIELSKTTPLDADEVKLITDIMLNAGFSQNTVDISIGEFIRDFAAVIANITNATIESPTTRSKPSSSKTGPKRRVATKSKSTKSSTNPSPKQRKSPRKDAQRKARTRKK